MQDLQCVGPLVAKEIVQVMQENVCYFECKDCKGLGAFASML